MIAQDLSNAHQGPAAGQVPLLIVDGLKAIHVQKHDAERAVRAARTVEFRFAKADEAPVVRQTSKRVGHRHRAHLFEKASLVQQCAGKHDDVAERLSQLREKERTIEKLPGKCCRSVANDVKRGHDKKRMIEEACGALLILVALEARPETNRSKPGQPSSKQ